MERNRKPAGFWKIFGASALSNFIVGGFVVVILLVAIGGIMYRFSQKITSTFGLENDVEITDGSVLKIDLDGPVSERTYVRFNGPIPNVESHLGLRDITSLIEEASVDDRIRGMVIKADYVNAGIATTEEIRNAIRSFKESGKFIYAYSDRLTQKAYYLASVADSVFMYPTGYIEFKGLSATLSFFKDFLNRNNLDMQVIRGSNNKFKSAVEPFLADEISEANHKQTKRFLDKLWDAMLEDISVERNISIATLRNIADSLKVRQPGDAVQYGLIDGTLYSDEFDDLLKSKLKSSGIKYVTLNKYKRRKDRFTKTYNEKVFPNVAVVYAFGEIHSGSSEPGSIGNETYVKAIKSAMNDSRIKAIVLRVNSPGGDALASDLIWDAVKRAREIKPVIVSMGDVAASGGYYISCIADKIYCDPTTITGSIGVFMVIPNTEKLFEDDLGIHFSRVKTGNHADLSFLQISLGSITRPLTDEERQFFQEGVDNTYDSFLTRVAQGRSKLEKSDVDSIGQGRVWSGYDALELGLVDEYGGLTEAIAYAAQQAGVSKPYVKEFPVLETKGIEKILMLMNEDDQSMSAQTNELQSWLLKQWEQLKTMTPGGSIQARLFFNYDIR